jgi:cytochrome b subunit of formate dehydrogenase
VKKFLFYFPVLAIVSLILALIAGLIMWAFGFQVPSWLEHQRGIKLFALSLTFVIALDVVFRILMNRLFFSKKFLGDMEKDLQGGFTVRAAFQKTCNKFRIPEWLRIEGVIHRLKKDNFKEYDRKFGP